MLFHWLDNRSPRSLRPLRNSRRLRLEALEDRSLMAVTVTGATITGVVEGTAGTFTAGTFTDTNPALTAAQFNVVVNYGDGTTPVTNVNPAPAGTTFDANLKVTGAAGPFPTTHPPHIPHETGPPLTPLLFSPQIHTTQQPTPAH